MAVKPIERKEEVRVERPERRVAEQRREEEPKRAERTEERRDEGDRKKLAEA